MDKNLQETLSMKNALLAKKDDNYGKTLRECLEMFRKTELVKLAHVNNYAVRGGQSKNTIITELEHEITKAFNNMLDGMIKLDYFKIMDMIHFNNTTVSEIAAESYNFFEERGYVYFFYDNYGIDENDKFRLSFPRELQQIYLHWFNEEHYKEITKRDTMHHFLLGMARLYGVFPKELFIQLWGEYNNGELPDEKILNKLLTCTGDRFSWYVGISDYIVIEDLIAGDLWKDVLKESTGKTYYIPSKQELCYYSLHEYEEDSCYYKDLYEFFHKKLKDEISTDNMMISLSIVSVSDIKPNELMRIINEADIRFDNIKESNRVLKILMEFCDHTRKWSEKGYRPCELRDMKEVYSASSFSFL